MATVSHLLCCIVVWLYKYNEILTCDGMVLYCPLHRRGKLEGICVKCILEGGVPKEDEVLDIRHRPKGVVEMCTTGPSVPTQPNNP